MNCRSGDMALVIAGPSTGKLVNCLEPLPAGWYRDDLPRGYRQQISHEMGPLWRLDRQIEWGDLLYLAIAPDRALMPIRPRPQSEPETTGKERVLA